MKYFWTSVSLIGAPYLHAGPVSSNGRVVFIKGPLHMSPVTGLAWLTGRILSSIRMENFSPVTELIFQPSYCPYWKFQLGYRGEQGVLFQVSSR